MKSFEFSHWDLSDANKGLLFFAQSLEEMLFHFGHDSLKVPALNFRFLCIEILTTIEKIDEEIIDKGNMRPLFEELRNSYEHDPIAKCLFGDEFLSLFFSKNAEGEIDRNCSEIYKNPGSDISIKQIKRVVEYFINDMGLCDKYFSELKQRITDTIKAQPFTIQEQAALYKMSKILLTELINRAYSQEYIYWVVNDVFYNHQRLVDNIDDILNLFWSHFDFQEKEYTVILPLKVALFKKHLSHFQNVSIRNNTDGLFGHSCKWVIELNVEAMDQYIAQTNAITLISFFTSLLQYNNHRSQSYSANKAIVSLNETGQVYNLETPLMPIRRGNVLSDEKNNEKIASMVNNFAFSPGKLVNVIELHASAINSNDVPNQLLNLWTIIEVLIPTEPKNSFSKINQICNVVTTVLNSQYVFSLLSQFFSDLHNCIPNVIEEQLANVPEGNNNIEKLAAVLVLKKYQTEYTNIISALASYPILQYRAEHYSNIFSNRNQLKDFLVEHRKRLSWHIMRIYRNRNMIVHDGSHFPYIDIIVQNLHYYVDSLIDTINLYAGKGYSSIKTIYTALQQKEYQYLLALEKKESDGSPKKVEDDYVSVVLGYM